MSGVVVGGLHEAKLVDAEVKALVAKLQMEAQEKAQAGGWNGLFIEFEPISYSSQVVAGKNYFVKVRVGADKYAHVRIYQGLDQSTQVAKVEVDKKADDPITYF